MAKPCENGYSTDKTLFSAYVSDGEAAEIIELARREFPDLTIFFNRRIEPDQSVIDEVDTAVERIVGRHYLAPEDDILYAHIFRYLKPDDPVVLRQERWSISYQSTRPASELIKEGIHSASIYLGRERSDRELIADLYNPLGTTEGSVHVYKKTVGIETGLHKRAEDYAARFAELLDRALPKEEPALVK